MADCNAQSRHFRGVVSVPDESSLPADRTPLEGWTVLTGVRGASAQRNLGLDDLDASVDVVVFFDDDTLPRSDYLQRATDFLARHPHVAGLTGRVLLDGKLTQEVPRATASAALLRSTTDGRRQWRTTRELYGANFAIRIAVDPSLRFDDRLPLYSWLEDHDLARRLATRGPLAEVDDCVIVHRAAESGGRKSHMRLGYSQVMNPWYLWRKGSFPVGLMLQQLGRPVARNVQRSLAGQERRWRRERLRGNAVAFSDVLRGRVTPERILELDR